MQDHDYRHENRDYVHETCCCVVQSQNIKQDDIIFGPHSSRKRRYELEKQLAWLEEQSSRYLNVPAVARRFNPMRCPYEWTDDESSGFANGVERPELDPHRKKVALLTILLPVYQRSVKATVAVGLSVDSSETKREKGALKRERRFEFVGNNDDDGDERQRSRSRGSIMFVQMRLSVTTC